MPTQLTSSVLPSTSTIIPTTSSSSSNFKQTSGEHQTILGFLPSPMAVETEQRFHVLAVDDSLPDRKLIEKLLKSSSYQVTTVDSGSKALEFLGIHEHDRSYPHDIEVNLIITDYCMPGMSGYDLLKKIKGTSSLRDIPVVVMSSENAPSRIHRCLEGGAEEFFLKPVQLSDMEKLRPHILRGRSRDYRLQQEHRSSQYPSSHDEEEEDEELQCDVSGNVVNFVKRKALGDGFSPERTRTRYDTTADGLAAVVYFPAISE